MPPQHPAARPVERVDSPTVSRMRRCTSVSTPGGFESYFPAVQSRRMGGSAYVASGCTSTRPSETTALRRTTAGLPLWGCRSAMPQTHSPADGRPLLPMKGRASVRTTPAGTAPAALGRTPRRAPESDVIAHPASSSPCWPVDMCACGRAAHLTGRRPTDARRSTARRHVPHSGLRGARGVGGCDAALRLAWARPWPGARPVWLYGVSCWRRCWADR